MRYDFDQLNDRRGTYCTQWDFIQDRFGRPGILPFSISDTDFLAPEPVVRRVSEVAARGLYGYTRWNHHDFTGAVASWYARRHGCELDEGWVVWSPSVMYTASALIRLVSAPGDGVLTLSPMYDSFPGVIEGNGRRMEASPLVWRDGAYGIDFADLERRARGCTALLLCAPHNPTGRVWTDDEMRRIVAICREHGLYLITDEIHADLVVGERPHLPALSYRGEWCCVATASSASKTFNTPGLGGSYVIIPDAELRDEFLDLTRHVDFLNSAALLGMHALMVGYELCDDYVDQLCAYVRANHEALAAHLAAHHPKVRFVVPDATYLAWMDVSGLDVEMARLQDALVNVGELGIMDGATYGEPGRDHLRMCLGCPRGKLEEGLRRMDRAISVL